MALPALQKTWQGGTTLGGIDLVNQPISEASSELTARTVLLKIKQALTTFNLNPWTVVGSSDSVAASMDTTDRWSDVSDLVFRVLSGGVHSWIVLQQSNIAANFQVCFDLSNILAADPNRQNLSIFVSVVAGFTGGSTTDRPTATDEYELNASTSPWLGSMTTGVATMLSCFESSDGQCTRIIASDGSTGIPFTAMGFERPRLPDPAWTNPSVFYILKETIASGNGCFERTNIQEADPFLAIIQDFDSNPLQVAMRIDGPMATTIEIAQDEENDSIKLYGGGLHYAGNDAEQQLGALFDWYWVSRNTNGSFFAADLDTFPAAGDRKFVCVGAPVIGWLDDSATDLKYQNI